MGTLRSYRQFFAFISVVLAALLLKDVTGAQCRSGCESADNNILRYAPGSTYSYDFDSLLTVSLTSGQSQDTSLKVQGRAQLYSQGNCAYTLVLDNVRVLHAKKVNPLREDFDRPVSFTWTNGQLEPEICADPADTEFSLNVKRAILSLLQTVPDFATSSLTETDVFGVCGSSYSRTRSGEAELVTKVRNLNACGHRENVAHGFISGVVNDQAGVKSTPLLNGDYSLEQKVKNGLIESAYLVESYKYVPFSTQSGAGAKAKVVTRLTLVPGSEQRPLPAVRGGTPKSIIFENPQITPAATADDVRSALKATVEQFAGAASEVAATQFTELIRLLRFASSEDLRTIWTNANSGSLNSDKDLTRRIYFDALFRSGSSASLHAIATLLRSRIFTDIEQKLAYLSFNLATDVGADALLAIRDLLDTKPPNQAYLSIGNLVEKYCKDHPDCETDPTIQQIAQRFIARLGGSCSSGTKTQEDTLVSVLKGLGNANVLGLTAAASLLQCLSDDKSARVRVTALQSLASTAECKEYTQSKAIQILKDRNEDSEIRIEAYLTVVACPTAAVASQIEQLLNAEPVYQVGSFITSHLKSLRDSTDSYRAQARQYFRDIVITRQFPIDLRRFSFNHEVSYALEGLGLGASADYNLIYSQQGFLPRSARLNVTGEVFGTTFNLFEVQARQENLENILEHFFGPKGVLHGDSIEVLYNILAKFQSSSGAQGNYRARRELRQDVNALTSRAKFDELFNAINFDYSVKLFGSEFFFLSLGSDVPISVKDFAQKVTKILHTGKRLENFQQQSKFHSLFVDTELVYTTGIGLPLQLEAQGTAVGSLDVATEIDFEKLLTDFRNAQFRVRFVPSSNVQVSGILKIDGYAVSTGLKVSLSLHSSTGSDLTFRSVEGNFDLDVQLPKARQDIVSLDHSINFVTVERGRPSQAISFKSKRSRGEYKFDQLSAYLGVSVTGVSNLAPTDESVALFPLNGPNTLGLSIEAEKRFTLNGVYSRDEAQRRFGYELIFNTPGSQPSRETSLKLEAGAQPYFVRASLIHPAKKLIAEAGLTNNEVDFLLYGELVHDDKKSTAKIGFTRSGGSGARIEYRPKIELKAKESDQPSNQLGDFSADGKLIVETQSDGSKVYAFEQFSVRSSKIKPVVLNGQITVESLLAGSTKLSVQANDNQLDVDGRVALSRDHILFKSTVRNHLNPDYNGLVSFELQRKSENSLQHDSEFAVGRDLNKKFKSHNFFEWQLENDKLTALKFENEVTTDRVGGKLKLNGEYAAKLLNYDFELALNQHKLGNSVSFRRDIRSQGDLDLQITALVNRYNAQLSTKLNNENSGRAKVNFDFNSNWGTKAHIEGDVNQHATSVQDAYVDLKGTFTLRPQEQEISWLLDFKGTARQLNSNAQLSRGSEELLSYHVLVTRAETVVGKFDATVKELIFTKGDFKARNGVGEGTAVLNFKKLGRKVKLVSSFTIAAPTYNVDTTLFYDFEKDNERKVHVVTENQIEARNFATKNTLEWGNNERLEANANGVYSGSFLNGKQAGEFNIVLPKGRQLSGQLKREAQTQNELTSGTASLKLTDAEQGQGGRSLVWNVQGSDVNAKAKTISVQHKIELRNKDGRTGEITIQVKNLPKGHYKTAAIVFNSRGDLFKEELSLNLNLDEYCKEHAVYRFAGVYGQLFKGNWNGNYRLGTETSKSTTYELTLNVEVPETELKSIKIDSNGKFVQPATADGVYEAELHFVEQLGQDRVRFDYSGKGNQQHGNWNVKYELPKRQPASVEGTYKREERAESGGVNQYQYGLVYQYEGDKIVKTNLEVSAVPQKSASIHYHLESPYEDVRNFDITFKAVKSEENSVTTNTQVIYNDKTYGLNSVATLADGRAIVDLTAVCPERASKLLASLERLGENKGKAKLLLENFGDFSFAGSTDFSFQTPDNFYLNVDLDSKQLKLEQVRLEVSAAQSQGSGKGVEFKATAAGKNLLSGSAQYQVKTERDKTVVEGQGQVRLYDSPKNANFKLVRQRYELARDGETGFSLSFNGIFGPKNIVSELKITNRNFNVKLASCEETRQCTNFEVKFVAESDKQKLDNVEHSLMILIDLRELGYPHEFELQSKTSRNGFRIEHELEANIISNRNIKYQFIIYLKPSKGGAQLKLPNREVAIEGTYGIPKEIFGRYDATLTLYLDKTARPNEKTQLSFTGSVSRAGQYAANAAGRLEFAHPALQSPLVISGNAEANAERQFASSSAEFDIFRSPEYKIVAQAKYQNYEPQSRRSYNVSADASVRSAGLAFDYSVGLNYALSLDQRSLSANSIVVAANNDFKIAETLYISPDRFEYLLTSLNEPVLSVNGNSDNQQNKRKLQATFKFLRTPALEVKAESNGFSGGSLQVLRKDGLFNIAGSVEAGREATTSVQGNGKKLFDGRLALDAANFLTSNYEIDEAAFEDFLKTAEKTIAGDTEIATTEVSNRYQKIKQVLQQQLQNGKASLPDFSGLYANFEHNLDGIFKELENDPAIKGIFEFYRKVYEAVSKTLVGLGKSLTETYTKLHEIGIEFYRKFSEAFSSKLLPVLQKFSEGLTSAIGKFYIESVKIFTTGLERLAKALKTFQGDYSKLGKAVNDFYKNFGTELQIFIKNFETEFHEVVQAVSTYFQSLPGLSDFRKKIDQAVSQWLRESNIADVVDEALQTIKEFMPTEELKQFVEALSSYLRKCLNPQQSEQNVNDAAEELRTLYSSLVSAVQSLIVHFRSEEISSAYFLPIPINWEAWRHLPTWSTFKSSIWNYFRNEKFGFYKDLLLRRLPHGSRPFVLTAHVADGQHIFTFDGRHMTFPGSCEYLLAHDFVHGNFSVVAKLEQGKLAAISLIDKADTLTLDNQGQLKLNGKPVDYPVHQGDIHAWRRYYTVTLLTEFGAEVYCTLDLRVCHITLNAFYTGRTYGLLGNGNQEPYDDFRKLDGTQAQNVADFGNDYAVSKCSPVAVADEHGSHSHSQANEICTDFFQTRFGIGNLLLNTQAFQEACEHATASASDKEDAACNIALAYASAARLAKIPLIVPVECVKCNLNQADQHKVGDDFTVESPQHKADVIFVVDTSLGKQTLAELIDPLLTVLRNQLNNKDFTDAQFTVIGYDNTQKYPQLLTYSGKLDFRGHVSRLESKAPKYFETPQISDPKLAQLFAWLQKFDQLVRRDALETTDAKAFRLALDYPFRAAANKVIVAIRSDSLELKSPLMAVGALTSSEEAKLKGIAIHLVGPVKDLQLNGVPNRDVVGFNSKQLLLRKGGSKGPGDVRQNLRYTSDHGTALVAKNDGFLFTLNNFQLQTTKQEKDQFVGTIAGALSDQIARTSVKNQCICSLAYGLHAEEACLATQVQLLAPQKRPNTRG